MKINDLLNENNSPWLPDAVFRNVTPDPNYGPDARYSDDEDEKYMILINGRPWKKNNKIVEFDSYDSANMAAETIITKYNKPAQVVSI